MIRNKNIINTLNWRKKLYNFGPDITVLQIPSFSFDSSVEDIFTPLISGSKLVLLKQNNTNFNVSMMQELIEKYHPNNMLVVPSFYNVLLNELKCVLFVFNFAFNSSSVCDNCLFNVSHCSIIDVCIVSKSFAF